MMVIIKRNGSTEPYNRDKITTAIQKCFKSTGTEIDAGILKQVVESIENFVGNDAANRHVECIQDEVERTLMEHGFYKEAKNYILYRWQRTERRRTLDAIVREVADPDIAPVLRAIQADFTTEPYDLRMLSEKFSGFCKPEMETEERGLQDGEFESTQEITEFSVQ